MYAVVEFTDQGEIGLIPIEWLCEGNKQALWPPFRSPTAISKAVKACIPPEVGVWKPYDIRVLRTCGKYKHLSDHKFKI